MQYSNTVVSQIRHGGWSKTGHNLIQGATLLAQKFVIVFYEVYFLYYLFHKPFYDVGENSDMLMTLQWKFLYIKKAFLNAT